jgi:predicted nucleic-acid-binding protein
VTEPLRLLDTSVVVRYLSYDIPDLAGRAGQLINSGVPLGITTVAILEASYVLQRPPYNQSRESVVDALIDLLRRRNVQGIGVDADQAALALLLCRPSRTVSFGDALIAATGRSAGVEGIYTFDARFGRAGLQAVAVPELPPPAEGPTTS